MQRFLSCGVTLQRSVFPALEDELGPLSDTEARCVRVVAVMDFGPWLLPLRGKVTGRTPEERHAIRTAFLATSVGKFPPTRPPRCSPQRPRPAPRVRRGDRSGDLPSEAPLSRAVAAFARGALPPQVPAALLHPPLGPTRIDHSSL